MTTTEVQDLFEKHEDEYCEFERIKDKPCNRRDLCAFILLDNLFPYRGRYADLICAAEHDQYWLSIEGEEFAKVATEANIIYLLRCGVRWDSAIDLLNLTT